MIALPTPKHKSQVNRLVLHLANPARRLPGPLMRVLPAPHVNLSHKLHMPSASHCMQPRGKRLARLNANSLGGPEGAPAQSMSSRICCPPCPTPQRACPPAPPPRTCSCRCCCWRLGPLPQGVPRQARRRPPRWAPRLRLRPPRHSMPPGPRRRRRAPTAWPMRPRGMCPRGSRARRPAARAPGRPG